MLFSCSPRDLRAFEMGTSRTKSMNSCSSRSNDSVRSLLGTRAWPKLQFRPNQAGNASWTQDIRLQSNVKILDLRGPLCQSFLHPGVRNESQRESKSHQKLTRLPTEKRPTLYPYRQESCAPARPNSEFGQTELEGIILSHKSFDAILSGNLTEKQQIASS